MFGWIKLHRKLLENGWLKNPKLLTFWIYCLLKATHEPFKAKAGYQEVQLEPGQFIFGLHKASEESFLSIQTIRTCLDTLRRWGNITVKSTNKFSIISIMNWDVYQCGELGSNKPLTNKQQTTNNIQEYKEQKNKYFCARFDLFYKSYPKRRARRDAEKAWIKLNPDESLVEVIRASLAKHKDSQDWQKDGGRYIPLPASWLNGRRWEDDLGDITEDRDEW
jgi:hypothetical protein